MAMINNCSSLSIERERSWVIDLEEKIANNNQTEVFDEENKWRKIAIFRLPEFVKIKKHGSFTPKVVAIGPYHHHKSDLQRLEAHKERALYNILKRGVKPLGVYVHEMMGVVEELQCSYVDLQEEWKNQDDFIKLMIMDGYFMLEIMRLDTESFKHYAPSDPFFSYHAMMHNARYIRRDMLILENQLPFLVFKKLVSIEKDVNEEEAERMVTELVVRFFMLSIYQNKDDLTEFTGTIHGLHVLDIYRRCHLFISMKSLPYQIRIPIFLSYELSCGTKLGVMSSAARLREAGIKFKRSSSSALTTIWFDLNKGILTLPKLTVDDSTEDMFLNMMALEHIHARSSSEISSYVGFMSVLMGSAEDVELLRRHGIVKNGLGSDEDVSRLFYSMSEDYGVSLWSTELLVDFYCRRWQNKYCAYLQRAYYVLAAGFINFLTLVSTVVSFLQWRNV